MYGHRLRGPLPVVFLVHGLPVVAREVERYEKEEILFVRRMRRDLATEGKEA